MKTSKRIELTIETSYLPSWGVWEGCRELIQNARDAEVEHSAAMDVRHQAGKGILVISNAGVNLPHEALLLGHTSKSERRDTIGKFGEGLKLGVLALVRAGHSVEITTGDEIWIPTLATSEVFDDVQVLVFQISSRGRKFSPQVRLEVSGIDVPTWKEMKRNFIFLSERKDDDSVKTSHGTLLLEPRMKGRVHVKGIFVQTETLEYGYDLDDVSLDRDRRLIGRYDLEYKLRQIWEEAVISRPDLVDPFYKLLQDMKRDAGAFAYSSVTNEKVTEAVVEKFINRFGNESIPVTNLGQSKDIEHLGRKGILVSETLANVLQSKLGRIEDLKAQLSAEIVERYAWGDLDEKERLHLETALGLIQRTVHLEDVDVVRFRSDNLWGQYREGRIVVAKKVLSNQRETLVTLVHEVAHRAGGDGAKGHVEEIEAIYSEIVVKFLGDLFGPQEEAEKTVPTRPTDDIPF